MDNKLVSIILSADFGFFRKPDFNNTLNLTYNIIHKPSILGILGAIVGFEGFKKKGNIPEYYNKLKHIPIGIKPLNDNNGNFVKFEIKYTNTIGYANTDGNLLLQELTIFKPSYQIFLLLNIQNEAELKLYNYLQNGEAEYIPYFGKNEFHCWFNKNDFKEYSVNKIIEIKNNYQINTIFNKNNNTVKNFIEEDEIDFEDLSNNENKFIYFERLPINYNETIFQYNYGEFIYTNYKFKNNLAIDNLYKIGDNEQYIQLN